MNQTCIKSIWILDIEKKNIVITAPLSGFITVQLTTNGE